LKSKRIWKPTKIFQNWGAGGGRRRRNETVGRISAPPSISY
jgi:hypothetical protein